MELIIHRTYFPQGPEPYSLTASLVTTEEEDALLKKLKLTSPLLGAGLTLNTDSVAMVRDFITKVSDMTTAFASEFANQTAEYQSLVEQRQVKVRVGDLAAGKQFVPLGPFKR